LATARGLLGRLSRGSLLGGRLLLGSLLFRGLLGGRLLLGSLLLRGRLLSGLLLGGRFLLRGLLLCSFLLCCGHSHSPLFLATCFYPSGGISRYRNPEVPRCAHACAEAHGQPMDTLRPSWMITDARLRRGVRWCVAGDWARCAE